MVGLTLVGAGGLAREVIALLSSQPHHSDVGLVDDDPALWGTRVSGALVSGGLDVVAASDGPLVVCVGRGEGRRKLVGRLAALGVDPDRYVTILHPSVEVPSCCIVGAGSILLAGAAVTADVTIGAHVVVMPNATLTHDVVIEDFATVCAGVCLGGGVVVGSGAYLGMNASVRQGLTVGADSVLGMGSALVRSLPPGEVWAGAPAARLSPTMPATVA